MTDDDQQTPDLYMDKQLRMTIDLLLTMHDLYMNEAADGDPGVNDGINLWVFDMALKEVTERREREEFEREAIEAMKIRRIP